MCYQVNKSVKFTIASVFVIFFSLFFIKYSDIILIKRMLFSSASPFGENFHIRSDATVIFSSNKGVLSKNTIGKNEIFIVDSSNKVTSIDKIKAIILNYHDRSLIIDLDQGEISKY